MNKDHQDYSTELPDASIKFKTIPVSLRKHLYVFKTISGIFSYEKFDLGTKVLIEHMIIPNKGNFLDLGCGYGAIGIVVAYESPGSNVYFIDVNKRAIWCTRENIKINLSENRSNFHVYTGSYFQPIKNNHLKFDSIYMNPPLRKGRQEFLNLFKQIPLFLKSKGSFQFVIRRKLGAEYIYKFLIGKYTSEKVKILCKRSGYWVFHFIQG